MVNIVRIVTSSAPVTRLAPSAGLSVPEHDPGRKLAQPLPHPGLDLGLLDEAADGVVRFQLEAHLLDPGRAPPPSGGWSPPRGRGSRPP